MEGLRQVFVRINEIQNMMKNYQPKRVKDFQDYLKTMQAKTNGNDKNPSVEKQDKPSSSRQPDEVKTPVPSNPKGNIGIQNKNVTKGDILKLITEASRKYGVSESLIKSVIKQESGFNPKAVSHAGAQGLMQLMPRTARSLGVKNSFDPRQNIFGGTKYLKGLLNRFGGNLSMSLAAYNAGESRVIKAGGVPNIRETKHYVRNVIRNYQKIKNLK